jgi:hypothetical protein
MSVPSSNEILNIIDNLEQKLNRHKSQYNPKEYPNIYTINDPNSKSKTEKRIIIIFIEVFKTTTLLANFNNNY